MQFLSYINYFFLITLCVVCALDEQLRESVPPFTEFTHSHWSNSLSQQTRHQTVARLRYDSSPDLHSTNEMPRKPALMHVLIAVCTQVE